MKKLALHTHLYGDGRTAEKVKRCASSYSGVLGHIEKKVNVCKAPKGASREKFMGYDVDSSGFVDDELKC